MKRISVVENLRVNVILFGSIIQVGDSLKIEPRAKTIAVQREVSNYSGKEGNFAKFSLFTDPIPKPVIEKKVTMSVHNKSPFIPVGRIRVLGLSAASVIQIGSTQIINPESRVKHFRQELHGEMSLMASSAQAKKKGSD